MTTTTPCSGPDRDRWFSGVRSQIDACREACSHCPILRECAQAALDTGAEYGVWATVALTGREDASTLHFQRKRLRKIADDGIPTLPRSLITVINQSAAIQLRASGMKPKEIAKQLNLGLATIYRYLEAVAA